jgi:8-oxo-dGTP pyrophosphatase MutT (NUDIX family)
VPGAPRHAWWLVKTRHDHSAGGLVLKGNEVLLIMTRSGHRWQLPRGHLEAGETSQQAAVREIWEETGVQGKILAPLRPIEYDYTENETRIHKRVDCYLLEYLGGSNENVDRIEAERAEWFSWDMALERLSFENERSVVRHAREVVDRMSATSE